MTALVRRHTVVEIAVAVFWAGIWAGAGVPETPAVEPARIEVDLEAQMGAVNPLILGTAIAAPKLHLARAKEANQWGCGVWDPEKRIPVRQFVAAGRQAGIGLLRMGCVLRNWKQRLIGPPEKRPVRFGLPEFLTYCEAIRAAPVLIVDGLEGTPQDAADLVEYLNAPADGSNPNGGIDWAARRAADGHREPYAVVWFEFDNEFYAGAGKKIKRLGLKGYGDLAEYYARGYLACRKAMKAVDPRIKLGANLQYPIWPWNTPILKLAGQQIDFGIPHIYAPQPASKDRERIIQSFLATAAYHQLCFDKLNEHVQQITGRSDLPWMVTEYNCGAQSAPVPFRFTLANALNVAQAIRVMMRPRNRVVGANFWNFANEMWGMVRGYPKQGQPLLRHAPFYVFQLYREHFGDRLIRTEVRCARWNFAGGSGIAAQQVPGLLVNAALRSKRRGSHPPSATRSGTGASNARASASRTAERCDDVTLMIVNTNPRHAVRATIHVHAWDCLKHSQAQAWSLVGESPWGVASQDDPSAVQIIRTAVAKNRSLWQITLPKHSLTAMELHLRCLCPRNRKGKHPAGNWNP